MDEPLWRGIEEFNAERFFEAHEVLEDLWHDYRESDRSVLQALIHIPAGFYHHQCDNGRGALSRLKKGRSKLQPFLPTHLGVVTAAVDARADDWVRGMTAEPSLARKRTPAYPGIETTSIDVRTVHYQL